MKFRIGDIVRGDDRYGITHSGSTLKVVTLFEGGRIEVEVLDSPGFPSYRGKHYDILEEYARLIPHYDPKEDIYRKIATIYKRYEERNW
jgi:hypothetical protein